jgi:hypothetical protein
VVRLLGKGLAVPSQRPSPKSSGAATTYSTVQRSFLEPPPPVSMEMNRLLPTLAPSAGATPEPRKNTLIDILDLVNEYERLEREAAPGIAVVAHRHRVLLDLKDAIDAWLSTPSNVQGIKKGRLRETRQGDAVRMVQHRVEKELKLMTLVGEAESFEGSLHWFGPSDPGTEMINVGWGQPRMPNAFNIWLRKEDQAEPDADSTMNCMEAILFMAYRAKLVSRPQLQEMYRRGVNLKQKLMPQGGTPFSYNAAEGIAGSPDPPAGSIILIRGVDHVVLATGAKTADGRHEVMSHWNYPVPGDKYAVEGGGKFQRTTLEEVLDSGYGMKPHNKVVFAPAPW